MTFAIYIRCGRVVFQWRRKLLDYTSQNGRRTKGSYLDSEPPASITKSVEVYIERGATEGPDRHPHSLKVPYNGPLSPATPPSRSPLVSQNSVGKRISTAPSNDGNRAALSYCKCAILFFLAMLCTWVPSSVNRVYSLVDPKAHIFALNLAASLVLPLQGFWNAVIYIATSLPACKLLMARITGRDGTYEVKWPLSLRKLSHPPSTRAASQQNSQPWPPSPRNFSYPPSTQAAGNQSSRQWALSPHNLPHPPSTRAASKRNSQQWPLRLRSESREELRGGDSSPSRRAGRVF